MGNWMNFAWHFWMLGLQLLHSNGRRFREAQLNRLTSWKTGVNEDGTQTMTRFTSHRIDSFNITSLIHIHVNQNM